MNVYGGLLGYRSQKRIENLKKLLENGFTVLEVTDKLVGFTMYDIGIPFNELLTGFALIDAMDRMSDLRKVLDMSSVGALTIFEYSAYSVKKISFEEI